MPELLHNQKIVRDKGIERSLLNLSDCGTGKTVASLSIADHWFKKGLDAGVVICPKNLIHEAWMPDAKKFFPNIDIVALDKTPEKRKKILYEDHQLFVITPQSFKNDFHLIQDRGFKMLFVDESSMMKNVKSQTTKAILTLAGFQFRGKEGVKFHGGRTIPYRYPMTATAAPNSPAEYWGQVKLCTGPGDAVFNENFYAFQARYFTEVDVTPKTVKDSPYYNERRDRRIKYVFKKRMFEEFCYKLASIAHVCRKQDMVDVQLPAQRHTVINIALDNRERSAYDQMAKDLVLKINSKVIKAQNILTEMMKLRQLSSGFIYGDNNKDVHRTGETKFQFIKHIIQINPSIQRLIFVNFQAEADQMRTIPNTEVIDGRSKKNSDILAAFRRGDIQNLAANQQSLSHGVTVTNCHDTLYASLNHSYEYMKQSRDRTHRIGQIHDCNYDYVCANNTMDGLIFKATLRKEAMVNSFLSVLVQIQNGQTPDFAGCDNVFNESYADIIKQLTFRHINEVM